MWEEYLRAQGHRLFDDFAESSKPIVQKDVLFGKQIGVFVPEKRRRNWGLLLDCCGDRKALGQAYTARRYKQDVQQDVSRRLPVGHPNAEVEWPDSHFRSSSAGASHKWPNHTHLSIHGKLDPLFSNTQFAFPADVLVLRLSRIPSGFRSPAWV